MQSAEIEDEGSVLKYMTKSEIEEQRSSLLIMTQRWNATCHEEWLLVSATPTAPTEERRRAPPH